jgi:hypothetical protein
VDHLHYLYHCVSRQFPPKLIIKLIFSNITVIIISNSTNNNSNNRHSLLLYRTRKLFSLPRDFLITLSTPRVTEVGIHVYRIRSNSRYQPALGQTILY